MSLIGSGSFVRIMIKEVSVRLARANDANAIASLHVRAWRETYEGIAPVEAVRLLDEPRRLKSWRKVLLGGNSELQTHVAFAEGELVGFTSFGSSDSPFYEGSAEVKHLYIDQVARGIGIGRRLMGIAFNQLVVDGHKKVGLAVVKENMAARAFYSRLGGVEIKTFVDPGPLWRSDNILVSWPL